MEISCVPGDEEVLLLFFIYIYIYICVCVCVCVCAYTHTYVHIHVYIRVGDLVVELERFVRSGKHIRHVMLLLVS